MVRAVKNIVDDIKNKIRTEGVSADDIVALFEEAYSSLASDNNLRKGQLQSLYATVNNVLANNKQLFSEEDRNYIRNMRDTEGAAVKKEPVVEIAPEEVVVENASVTPLEADEKPMFDFDVSENEASENIQENKAPETTGENNKETPTTSEPVIEDSPEEVVENASSSDEPSTPIDVDEVLRTYETSEISNKERIQLVNQKIKEIYQKYRKSDATADDIIVLFREAYDNLPTNEASLKASMDKLEEAERKVVKARKDLFTEEKRKELSTMRSDAKESKDNNSSEVVQENEAPEENSTPETPVTDEKDKEKPVTDEKDKETPTTDEKDKETSTTDDPVKEEVSEEEVREFVNYWFGNSNVSDATISFAVKAFNNLGGDEEKLRKMYEFSKENATNEEAILANEIAFEIAKSKTAERNNDFYFYKSTRNTGEDERIPDDKVRDSLNVCYSILSKKEYDSLSFTDEKPSKKEIRELLDKGQPFSMDQLLWAHKYFSKDEKYANAISEQIERDLVELISNPQNITPNNIKAVIALAARCGNIDLRHRAYIAVAEAADKFNNQYFGNLTEQEVYENYTQLSEKASKIDPFAKPQDENEIDLSKDVSFISDDNKPLSDKDVKSSQECVTMLARELAVQSLVCRGKDITEDALREEVKAQALKILHGANINTDKENPRIVVSEKALIASLAKEYVEANKFKNAVEYKFKKTKLAQAVNKSLNNIDKKLKNKYGEKYEKAKGIFKFVGNIAKSSLKTVALYTAASFVPGGIPVLMAYNAGKSWYNTYKQLKDKKLPKSEKIGAIINSTVTTAFSAVGIGAGGAFTSHLGEAAVSGMQYARMGIVAAANTSSNVIQSAKLRLQQYKINKQLKGLDPESEEAKALVTKREAILTELSSNRKAAGKKVAATALGMFIAQTASGIMRDEVNNADNNLSADMRGGEEHSNDMRTSAGNESGDAGYVDDGSYDNGDAGVSDLTELQAQNLEAANEPGSSGLGNESSYEHTVRHLYNLDDARINGADGLGYEDMAENLCENFGQDANRVTIACKMAPYALQDALGLELPEGANPTTYQMLDYMSEHPLTPEQMESLNEFLDENFDGVRFMSENFETSNPSLMSANSVVNENSSLDGAQSADIQTDVRTEVNVEPEIFDSNSQSSASANIEATAETDVNVDVNVPEGSRVSVEVNLGGGAEEPQQQSEVEKFFNEELATEEHRRHFVERNEDGSVNARYTFVPGNEEIDGPREITETTTKFSGDSRMVITHEYNDGSRMKIVVPDAGPAFRDDIISVSENSEGVSETIFRDGRTMVLNNEDGTRFITDKDGNITYQGPTNTYEAQVVEETTPSRENVNVSSDGGKQNIRINVTVDTPEAAPQAEPVVETQAEQATVEPVAENVIIVDPVPDLSNPYEYARANGLIYDARLSAQLNIYGDDDFDGYAGIFRCADDPSRAVVLPNNMVDDSDYIRECDTSYFRYIQSEGREEYWHSTHYHARTCYNGSVGYYSTGDKFYDACHKIDMTASTAEHVVHSAEHIVRDIDHIVHMFDRR